MAHDRTDTSNRPSPRRRTWRWLAAAAAGLFSLGLAAPAGASSHSGGINILLGDGSVRFVNASTVNGSWMVDILPFIEQDNIFRSAPTSAAAVNFVMGDGSVRSVSGSIDIAAWQALGTRSDGQVIGDW
jgi:prepilin-type processing-associated H-X9-DG protein